MHELKLYNVKTLCQGLRIARNTFYNMKKDGLTPEPFTRLSAIEYYTKAQVEEIRSKLRPEGHPKTLKKVSYN